MIENLNQLAREIVENNQYCSLSTSDADGVPWISPVVYVYDENWNLYFVSIPASRHCKNINLGKLISVSIFDSHQNWGEGVGLQIEAEARVLRNTETLKAAKLYASRKYPYGGLNAKIAMDFIKSMVLKGKMYKIYKIVPLKVWMNNPNETTDVRVAINLSET
jgi:uncharacterized protein YhbP (UPF0306 family)